MQAHLKMVCSELRWFSYEAPILNINFSDHILMIVFTMVSSTILYIYQIPELLRDFVPTFHGVAADKQHGYHRLPHHHHCHNHHRHHFHCFCHSHVVIVIVNVIQTKRTIFCSDLRLKL